MSSPPGWTAPWPQSYPEAARRYQNEFLILTREGSFRPYIWPYCAFGPSLFLLYLLLPPTKSKFVYYLRYPVFTLVVYFSFEAILLCKSAYVAYAYCIGIMNAWAILWSASLLIFRDARSEFKRIEGRVSRTGKANGNSKIKASEDRPLSSSTDTGQATIKQRTGTKSANGQSAEDGSMMMPWTYSQSARAEHLDQYVWQGLPENFLHRLDWVTDLGCSFRGPRWNFRISNLAPPPSNVQASLRYSSLERSSSPTICMTRGDILRRYLPQFVRTIMLQDIIKTVAMQDPYFWAVPASSPSPFPWPRASRTLLSVLFTYNSLQALFLLLPLLGGLALGPDSIGEHGWPWTYRPFFGHLSDVSQRGLAGAWGQWWQQIFRMAFDEAGKFSVKLLGWDETSQRGAVLKVLVAFLWSGFLHACASYTTTSPTRPMRAFLFFAIQPLGIFPQRFLSLWLRKQGWRDKIPESLRQLGNLIAVAIWFHYTGPLVADDFAACGVWLYEPLPISPIRGLRGEGWWRWGGSWFGWHSDEIWWKRGITL